ncbi:aspartate aminotransferase family protein [Brevibacillus invocatus]|uniref:aspartate aminotransferase family protein n=1 Tax=Brevibacillus invocatus TaxID=173959 RepID=UPI00203C5C06|nr:aspartate aminotransferase family protein [Brevibacillus invocatus]MCM3082013.1 aspartate aminotransferase family protein [Brevibacillus invocatus]MCM3432415.1 aspartate aminotransferase family protein [Brevibacillus invocatus]
MTTQTKSLYERANAVMPPVASRATTLGVVKGKGSYLWSEDGKKYLDFASGVAVTNVGHNHPLVVERAKAQMDELIHGGHNVVYYPVYVELAEKLNELNGGNCKVYFSNSGAEVNEGAIKLAKKVTKRPGIISFKRSFHGRTIATTTLTASNSTYRKDYEGLLPSVYYAEYPYALRSGLSEEAEIQRCLAQLDEIFRFLIAPDQVAAIIMEPVQGEGGYIIPPQGFMQAIRDICDQHGILLIFDEIQTGFGRTGKMFAWQHFGIQPDVLTLAKGIANGFPLSALVAKAELMDQWTAGTHGGTYGGNPVACAASLAVIELLEGGVLDNCNKMGAYFIEELSKLTRDYPQIADIRGLGLMIGLECLDKDGKPDSKTVSGLKDKAMEKGLILLTCGTDKNVIRFIPPATVTKEEIDEAMSIIRESLSELK